MRILVTLISGAVYWLICAVVLWWVYDIGQLIRAGTYSQSEALAYVLKMALILSILTLPIWLLQKHPARLAALAEAWNVAWKTGVVLIVYAVIVIVRRQSWSPEQGVSDYVMFLPVVGRVNGQFFAEFNWLLFIFPVVPVTAAMSGVLYLLQSRILK